MPRQGGTKKGVNYVQNEDPDFIKRFKAKTGFKEESNVNSKRQMPDFNDDGEDEGDIDENDEEKPQVVVLKKGDLTAEEVQTEIKEEDEGPANLEKKITFKRPIKRAKEEVTEEAKEVDVSEDKKKKKSKKAKSKPTSLLSFNDEEEEDG